MKGTINDWFSLSIWHFPVDNYQHLNLKLLQLIQTQGMQISNILGWHSIDNLNQRDNFQYFMQIIMNNVWK